jgi:hypothetical protein
MAAGNYDLQITQGKTYDVPFAYKTGAGVAIPLTGYTLRMQIRASYDASTYFLELTTANGRGAQQAPGRFYCLHRSRQSFHTGSMFTI